MRDIDRGRAGTGRVRDSLAEAQILPPTHACDICGAQVLDTASACAGCGERPLFVLARESGWEYMGDSPGSAIRTTIPLTPAFCDQCGNQLRASREHCQVCGSSLG